MSTASEHAASEHAASDSAASAGTVSLPETAAELLVGAHGASSGRSARTIHGGHEHALRQTLLALAGGRSLGEHGSPGEATLQVVIGRVRLTSGDSAWEASAGDHLAIPDARHDLAAIDDSVVLLTVVKADVA